MWIWMQVFSVFFLTLNNTRCPKYVAILFLPSITFLSNLTLVIWDTRLLVQCGRHRAETVCPHYCWPSREHCRSPFLSGVRSPECFASHLLWKCKNNIRKEKQRLTDILGFSRYIIKTIIPLHRFNLILTGLQIPNVWHYATLLQCRNETKRGSESVMSLIQVAC